eukprot:609826-Pyramimonas_sp.AAC.1
MLTERIKDLKATSKKTMRNIAVQRTEAHAMMPAQAPDGDVQSEVPAEQPAADEAATATIAEEEAVAA